MQRTLAAAAVGMAVLLAPLAAAANPTSEQEAPLLAQEERQPRPRYAPDFRRFGLWDYLGTGVLTGAYYLVEFTQKGPTSATWAGNLPLDRPARDLLAGSSHRDRELSHKWSDYLWYSSVAYPVLDSLITPSVRSGGFEVSWNMTLMNFQSFMLVSLLIRMPHKWIGRLRPDAIGCANDPHYSVHCGNDGLFVSFPGGHVAVSMTGAGLSCAHHLHGHLYGSPLADGTACAAALGVASTVGYLRMRADSHWLSDQLVGTSLGLLSGYLVPTLLYYHPFWERRKPPVQQRDATPSVPRVALMPWLDQQTIGAALLVAN